MIILADRYTVQDAIAEERDAWVNKHLILLGFSEDNLSKITKFDLFQNNIEITEDIKTKYIEIKKDNLVIAEWFPPVLTPKLDENNKIYYEVELKYHSTLEEDEFYFG